MAIPAQDRPIQKLREETIDQLTVNYAQGELSFEAFDRRLDQAIEAQDHSTLTALTQDLELKVDKQYIDQKKQEIDELPYRENDKDPEKIVTILGSSKRSVYGEMPKEFQLTNILGTQNLDFCDAEILHNTVYIHVFNLLATSRFYFPKNFNVVSKVNSIMGDIKMNVPATSTINGPTVVIKGTTIMGNIRCIIKKPIKKQLLDFAEKIRAIIG